MNTEKPIKLKNGNTLPAGLLVSFNTGSDRICHVHADRAEPYRVHITAAFNAPSMSEIEDAVCDGCCPSITGETVEPDGHGPEGDPSWLLALDLI